MSAVEQEKSGKPVLSSLRKVSAEAKKLDSPPAKASLGFGEQIVPPPHVVAKLDFVPQQATSVPQGL